MKNITLAFEGLDAEGSGLDLMIIENMVAGLAMPGTGRWAGPLSLFILARLRHTFLTVSRFAQAVSTAPT
jgi:hypothetical protein